MADTQTENTTDTASFIADALQRFREAEEAESELRREALDDIEFWTGKQWPYDIASARQSEGRPCLTMNRLPDFVSKVVNEQRQRKPSIQINPVGSGADVETAEALEGLVRHICQQSEADDALEEAYQIAVVSGLGYFRVKTDYRDDGSFNQEIRIERIKNRFSVYYDPFCHAPDCSDARYCFVVEDIPRSEFKARYPEAQLASLDEIGGSGNTPAGWVTAENVRIAEYWRAEETRRTISGGEGDSKRQRVVVDRKVVCYVINALETLEKYEWPGRTIPIVPVIVSDVDVNGRRKVWGLVRFAKDPQRQYNYHASAATEAVALAPKAPYVAVEGQLEGHEEKWQTANIRNWPYLLYKPVSVAGQPAQAPQRQTVEPPIQAMMALVSQADNDLKAVTGLFDASLGAPGPEQSARAILARQNQGGVSTMTYTAALSRALKMTGRILLEIIPKIYDAPRVEHILNPDGSFRNIALFNSGISDMTQEGALASLQQEQQAIQKIYDVGVGQYDVTVSVGPSYQSKRQESVASMMTLINSYPQIVPIAGDILVRNMDWPGADELADRLQKMLPAQLQPVNGDPKIVIGQLQQQLQAVTQQNQQLIQKLEAATDTILTKQIEAQSRERIAQLNAQAGLLEAEIKAKTTLSQAQTAADIAALKTFHESAHEAGLEAAKHARENLSQIPTGGDQTPGTNPV